MLFASCCHWCQPLPGSRAASYWTSCVDFHWGHGHGHYCDQKHLGQQGTTHSGVSFSSSLWYDWDFCPLNDKTVSLFHTEQWTSHCDYISEVDIAFFFFSLIFLLNKLYIHISAYFLNAIKSNDFLFLIILLLQACKPFMITGNNSNNNNNILH